MSSKIDGISELAKAGVHRFEDAQQLFAAERWRGSMYLAGYVVECELKTALMRKFNCATLRDLEDKLKARRLWPQIESIYTHSLEKLLKATGRFDALQSDPALLKQFQTTNTWVPGWRYDPRPVASSRGRSREITQQFLDAVHSVAERIRNNV